MLKKQNKLVKRKHVLKHLENCKNDLPNTAKSRCVIKKIRQIEMVTTIFLNLNSFYCRRQRTDQRKSFYLYFGSFRVDWIGELVLSYRITETPFFFLIFFSLK